MSSQFSEIFRKISAFQRILATNFKFWPGIGWSLAGFRQGLSLLGDIHPELKFRAATIAAFDSVCQCLESAWWHRVRSQEVSTNTSQKSRHTAFTVNFGGYNGRWKWNQQLHSFVPSYNKSPATQANTIGRSVSCSTRSSITDLTSMIE